MENLGHKLMTTLEIAVGMLDDMKALVPVLQGLGRRHASYGVTDDMYASAQEALLLTLRKGLGSEYTGDTRTAWAWILRIIFGICIEAANETGSVRSKAPTSNDFATTPAAMHSTEAPDDNTESEDEEDPATPGTREETRDVLVTSEKRKAARPRVKPLDVATDSDDSTMGEGAFPTMCYSYCGFSLF